LLDLGARRQLLKLNEAVARLKATNFRCTPEIMDALLQAHEERNKLDSRAAAANIEAPWSYRLLS
jgi:hypothetical protein